MGRRRRSVMARAGVLALLPLGALLPGLPPAPASDVPATRVRLVGHPRAHFPLAVHLEAGTEGPVQAVIRTAVADWNRVATEALGREAFSWSDSADGSAVLIRMTADAPERLFGETWLDTDDRGTLRLPVRIVLREPVARGQTPPERLLYQVAAHELGHALGLPHANEPRSLMCCDPGSLNFEDPAVRDAYIQARRQPDVRSALAQLTAHYRRFWGPE